MKFVHTITPYGVKITRNSAWLSRAGMLVVMAAYWLCLMHIPFRSNGGWGTDLPLNLMSWGVVGLMMTGCWLFLPLRMSWSPIGGGLVAGAVLMSLPLIWSPSVLAGQVALPRIVGMWGLVLFYLTLRQSRLHYQHGIVLTALLAAAGGIQTVYTLWELLAPNHWLPEMSQLLMDKYGYAGAGIFGQVNVTASFLAATLGLMLYLSGLLPRQVTFSNIGYLKAGLCLGRWLLMLGLILTPAALVLLKSRTGWLGGMVVITGMPLLLLRHRLRRGYVAKNTPAITPLIVLPLAGILLGTMLMSVTPAQALREHDSSNQQRLLTLYHSLMMMKAHPLAGFGAGSYQAAYQDHMAALPGGNPGKEIMGHPHNELLYQYVEGGIPAAAGALLWGLVWLVLWRRASTVRQTGLLLSSIPILLHIQLEYPLYYSVPHGLVLMTLLALSEEARPPDNLYHGESNYWPLMGRVVGVLFLLYCSTSLWQCLKVVRVLDQFEDTTQASVSPSQLRGLQVPWILQPRYQHDLSLLRLVEFRNIPDKDSLRQFVQENAQWLSVYADRDGYKNEVDVLDFLHQSSQAATFRTKADRIFHVTQ